MFVWHTMEDQTVPVENTLLLTAALRRAGVPCEVHLFQKGVHGTSISTVEVGGQRPPPPLAAAGAGVAGRYAGFPYLIGRTYKNSQKFRLTCTEMPVYTTSRATQKGA